MGCEVSQCMKFLTFATTQIKERKQMQSSVCGKGKLKGFEKTISIFRKNCNWIVLKSDASNNNISFWD